VARIILALSERQRSMEELEGQLRLEAYRVQVVAPGTRDLQSFAPDLILVDASDPDQDALAIMEMLPRTGTPPLLLLTGAYTDRIVAEALEAGADGCLPAQTSARELAAWVRAILRRRALPAFVRSAPFRLGTLTIDLARGRIEKRGVPLLLPPTPLLLLRTLAERPGQVVPREHLLTQVLGPHPRRKMSTLHVHIFTLRAIIEDDPRNPRYVKTVRGIGYVLSEEGEGSSRGLPLQDD
jgi:DNA-binding response OmpR family regulator